MALLAAVAGRGRACTKMVGVRSFGAAAAAAEDHVPPVKLFGIPARYANAAYVIASRKGQLDMVKRDLTAFKHVMDTNDNFRAYLHNPSVSRNDKVSMIENAFDAKSKTSQISKNLLVTMAGNARLQDVRKVVEAYTVLVKAKRGEIDVIVTTADILTLSQEEALQASLKAQVGPDKKVLLTNKVDPKLVGGLTVQIGDRFLDLSIASKIDGMKNLMRTAVTE